MLINIYYTVYFGILDLSIFLILIQSYKIRSHFFLYSFIIILTGILLQIGLFNNKLIFSNEDFFNLMFFSLALIIIHYATGIQVKIFKNQNIKGNELNQKINSLVLSIFNFMRNRFFYILVYSYQVLSIWIIEFK